VTTSSHWPKVVPTINRTNKACATRAMRPKARPNACAACAGHGSDQAGEGEVKSLAPTPGNRPVPQIFTCAGFGGGGTPRQGLKTTNQLKDHGTPRTAAETCSAEAA
jgi:hypothetical protein